MHPLETLPDCVPVGPHIVSERVTRQKPRYLGLNRSAHLSRTINVHVEVRIDSPEAASLVPSACRLVITRPSLDESDSVSPELFKSPLEKPGGDTVPAVVRVNSKMMNDRPAAGARILVARKRHCAWFSFVLDVDETDNASIHRGD